MFADDTTIVFRDKNIEALKLKVNTDLSSASDWLAENRLSLNVTKTKFMRFDLSRSKNLKFSAKISNEPIEEVGSQKFLGVIFDKKLNWKQHINYHIKIELLLRSNKKSSGFFKQILAF